MRERNRCYGTAATIIARLNGDRHAGLHVNVTLYHALREVARKKIVSLFSPYIKYVHVITPYFSWAYIVMMEYYCHNVSVSRLLMTFAVGIRRTG